MPGRPSRLQEETGRGPGPCHPNMRCGTSRFPHCHIFRGDAKSPALSPEPPHHSCFQALGQTRDTDSVNGSPGPLPAEPGTEPRAAPGRGRRQSREGRTHGGAAGRGVRGLVISSNLFSKTPLKSPAPGGQQEGRRQGVRAGGAAQRSRLPAFLGSPGAGGHRGSERSSDCPPIPRRNPRAFDSRTLSAASRCFLVLRSPVRSDLLA